MLGVSGRMLGYKNERSFLTVGVFGSCFITLAVNHVFVLFFLSFFPSFSRKVNLKMEFDVE